MKAETAARLADADGDPDKAQRILAIDIYDQAARLAYYAQFRAALALIVERTDKTPKTQKGVTRLFHQIAKTEAGMDQRLAGDLTNAYRFKELADYETTMHVAHQRLDHTLLRSGAVLGHKKARVRGRFLPLPGPGWQLLAQSLPGEQRSSGHGRRGVARIREALVPTASGLRASRKPLQ